MRERPAKATVRWAALLLVLAAVVSADGCSATRTPFSRAAADAGSTLSAAAETLKAVHSGDVTREYAQGSFVNFADQLAGVADELPQLEGAPDKGTVDGLVALLMPAVDTVGMPCLEGPCDPGTQLAALEAARDAFVAASGS